MRILAFSPFDVAAVSGNSITLRRLQGALGRRGHTLAVVRLDPASTPEDAARVLREAQPDVVHFYHAYKTGRLLPALAPPASVVTVSGTDLNQDYQEPDRRAAIERTLAQAGRIVTYNASLADKARAIVPDGARKITVLPKGVTLGGAPFKLRGEAGLKTADFVFLHPGGVRPVKQNLFAVQALAPLAREDRRLRLVFAGPFLDSEYGEQLRREMAEHPWVRHLEDIPFDSMAAAYRASDAVLNTSLAEGLSNALMEAMAAGRPILAADIPGNRDLIRHGETGLLYATPDDFKEKARQLMADEGLRRALGEAARAHAASHFSTDAEAEALLQVYTEALAAK